MKMNTNYKRMNKCLCCDEKRQCITRFGQTALSK